jgi:phage gp36-like protein
VPYCSETAFKERFGAEELANLLATDTDRTYAAAAADADAIVDGYVGSRYTLPLVTVPAFVVGIAADLTRYELYEEAPTKEVIERRKMALDMLRDIRDGNLVLPGADTSAAAPAVAVKANDTVFTEERLGCFLGGL